MMIPAFGFSVGDFIAALELVSTVIDALRESGDSTAQCRSVTRQLVDLETALIHVRRLELDDSQATQMHALRQSTAECRRTIDEFLAKIAKYQPLLSSQPTSTPQLVRQSWLKVRWALCRKGDLERFKADLSGHTEAINVLMNAIQLERMTLDAKSQAQRHSSLKLTIRDCFADAMQKLAETTTYVSTSASNSTKILDIVTNTARIDCTIFAIVLDIHRNLQTAIAPQVLCSQPVYFVDARGVSTPFHLEFVRSVEAFVFILRDNLKDHKSAANRIERGDFVISDVVTKRDIDLSKAWNVCFRPGQHVDMSMLLDELDDTASTCPSCKFECTGNCEEDTTCLGCGLTFRRVTGLEYMRRNVPEQGLLCPETGESNQSLYPEIEESSMGSVADDDADELLLYRKVRMRRFCMAISATEATADTNLLAPPKTARDHVQLVHEDVEEPLHVGFAKHKRLSLALKIYCHNVRSLEDCIDLQAVQKAGHITKIKALQNWIKANIPACD